MRGLVLRLPVTLHSVLGSSPTVHRGAGEGGDRRARRTSPAPCGLARRPPAAWRHAWGPSGAAPRGRYPTPGETLRAVLNLTREPQPFTPPAAESWLVSSAAGRYDGGRHEALPLDHLLPYACVACGPASWNQYL
jgi:hypothetical protein